MNKFYIFTGFVISITLSFFIGYSLGKNNVVVKTVTPVVDTTPLQTVSKKMDATSNKIDTQIKQFIPLLTQLKILSEQTANTLKILEQQTNKQPTPNLPIIPQVTDELDEDISKQLKMSLALIDSHNVEQKVEDLFLGNREDREKAIKAIAQVSSPEVKKQILNFILDPNEDIGVRLTAIESFDWKDEVETLANIFQTDESHDIRLATIYTARETKFNDSEKEQLNQVFFQEFQAEPNEFVKLAILDYFSDNQPEKIEQLLTLVPLNDFSPEVRKQVELLQTNPLKK